MRLHNLAILDRLTLKKLEKQLDKHTLAEVPPDEWTAFSWSVSRHRTFERCKRLYYLTYYGSRRVREANKQVVSAVWWLKQVTSLATWIGTVIHHAAGMAVKAYRDGKPVGPGDLVDRTIRYYRDGVRASERGAKHDGKWVVLFGHVYPDEAYSIDRDQAEQRVVDLTQTFLESDGYTLTQNIPPTAIREVDEPFQSFILRDVPRLGDVRAFAIPDVLIEHEGKIQIIDWKTGDVSRPELREQAGFYRLYARQRYKAPEEQIEVSLCDLAGSGELIGAAEGTPTVMESLAMAHQSIAAMVEHMSDLEYNTVSITTFPRTDDLSLCQRCGFKRVCWRHEL